MEQKVKVALDSATPWTYAVNGILQARILEWVAFPFSRGSSQPRDRTQVFCIAGSLLSSWAAREAQEYWVGNLSLLQGIFPIQESNLGILHCRPILYQLSYKEKRYRGGRGTELHGQWLNMESLLNLGFCTFVPHLRLYIDTEKVCEKVICTLGNCWDVDRGTWSCWI